MEVQKLKIGSIPAILWGKDSDKIVVAVHGSHSSKIDDCTWVFAEEAAKRGWQTLSFDLPQHGERVYETGPCMVDACVEELHAVMAFARERAEMVSVFGCSMGAYFSLLAYVEEKLEKVFFLSPVTDMERVIRNIMYACNISEEELGTPVSDLPLVMRLKERLAQEDAQLLVISAKVEEELSMLEPEEKQLFMQELGIAQSGLDQLVQESYSLLGLISFLTAGEDEVRAWTITRGTKAPQAAGKIHTDFERGFIKAEVIAFDALRELGGDMLAAKEKGLVRQEGKEYVMQDGDVVLFKFNV